MSGAISIDCFVVSESALLVAAADGRCWRITLASRAVDAMPASSIAARRGTLAASAVEGAVSAGLAPRDDPATPFTLQRYIRWLAGNYIFAGQTPALFRRGAERLNAMGRVELALACLRKAAEEAGHARLAYRDLGALGIDAAEAVELVQPPSATIFADRFRAYVESAEPVALFGFSYCLERMAVERDERFIARVTAVCPVGSNALSFLKVHSATGSDGAHVYEQLYLFESLPLDELRIVVRATYETACLLAEQQRMDEALSDEEINRRLGLSAFRTD